MARLYEPNITWVGVAVRHSDGTIRAIELPASMLSHVEIEQNFIYGDDLGLPPGLFHTSTIAVLTDSSKG